MYWPGQMSVLASFSRTSRWVVALDFQTQVCIKLCLFNHHMKDLAKLFVWGWPLRVTVNKRPIVLDESCSTRGDMRVNVSSVFLC
jgi:hypothetical protein